MSDTKPVKRIGVKDIISKKIGILSVVGMFYSMCCAGAYGIEVMVSDIGPGLTIALLLILPFVWALPYCFICAELASARPVEGGSYMWVKEALGEFWYGILIIAGFLWTLVCNTVYVVLAVGYLGRVIEMNDYQSYALKIGLMLVFFIINVLGLQEVGWTSTVLSIAVVGAFLVVTIVGFAHMQTNPVEPFLSDEYEGNLVLTLGAGLGIGMWMYSGYDEISVSAGEIDNAKKVIPKAMMLVIPLIILTYVLPTLAGLGSVGQWESWTFEPGGVSYQTVLDTYTPNIFSIAFVVVAVLAHCSIFNIVVMTGSRTILIMADENFGPKGFARLASKRRTPVIGLIVVIIPAILLLGTPTHPMEFTFLVLVDVFFAAMVYSLTVVAAMILKRRIPDNEVPFKTPGGRVGHTIMACLVFFFCIALVLTNGTDYYLGGLAIMLVLPIFYVIAKWIWKGATVKEPQLYPIDSRTKLGFGDVTRLGGYYLGLGLFGILCRFFLEKYEENTMVGYWVTPEDLADDHYAQDMMDQFPVLVKESPNGNTYIPGWYETEYNGTGLFSDFYAMLDLIFYIGIGSAVAGVVLLAIGKALKKTEKQHVA